MAVSPTSMPLQFSTASPRARYEYPFTIGLRGKYYRALEEIYRAVGEVIPGFGGNITGLRGKSSKDPRRESF